VLLSDMTRNMTVTICRIVYTNLSVICCVLK